MEKIMEMFFERVLANSIPVALLAFALYRYLKILKNKSEITEDKVEAFMKVLLNGNYSEFEKHYERIRKEREDKNK